MLAQGPVMSDVNEKCCARRRSKSDREEKAQPGEVVPVAHVLRVSPKGKDSLFNP